MSISGDSISDEFDEEENEISEECDEFHDEDVEFNEEDETMENMGSSDSESSVAEDECIDTTVQNVEFSQCDQELMAEVHMMRFDDLVHEGTLFKSLKDAYAAYNEYARKVGFSVRKGNSYRRADGSVRCKIFVCYKQGHRTTDRRNKNVKTRRVKERRTGCAARLMIKHNRTDGDWIVAENVRHHNHPLATPSKSHTLPSHRKIEQAHEGEINNLEAAGIQPTDGYEFMVEQAGGHANVGFTRVDYKNYLRKKRLELFGTSDAQEVINYFIRKKSENSNFFSAIMFDDENQITNLFWADATSLIDYSHFGDVVVFDTTYKTNRYRRPFAPFVGVNHHRESVIFGGALLIDETTKSFVWLFETFLKAMGGKKPITILTDQCAAMAKAISIVFPETQHRLCLWHIFQNAAKHLSHVYKLSGFKNMFNWCIYGGETEEEFLDRWNQMVVTYDLVENDWLIRLFQDRHKWALVYARGTFCAGMTTTQRSESMNALLKKFVKRRYKLRMFLFRMERALGTRRHTELLSDAESIKSTPSLYAPAPLLKQAAATYTHAAFYYFEDEYKDSLVCDLEEVSVNGDTYTYKVTREGRKRRIVTYDHANHYAECSCKMFEFAGIICCHIMRVFFQWNVRKIPERFILKRWTNDAKRGLVIDNSGNPIKGDANADISFRYNDICRLSINFASKGAIDEDLHLLAKNIMEEGIKKLDDVINAKRACSTEVERSTNKSLLQPDSEINLEIATVAEGSEKGRKSGLRLKGCLEQGKRKGKNAKKIASGGEGNSEATPQEREVALPKKNTRGGKTAKATSVDRDEQNESIHQGAKPLPKTNRRKGKSTTTSTTVGESNNTEISSYGIEKPLGKTNTRRGKNTKATTIETVETEGYSNLIPKGREEPLPKKINKRGRNAKVATRGEEGNNEPNSQKTGDEVEPSLQNNQVPSEIDDVLTKDTTASPMSLTELLDDGGSSLTLRQILEQANNTSKIGEPQSPRKKLRFN